MKNLTRVISGRFELLPFVYKCWCCGRDQQSVCIHDVKWLYCFSPQHWRSLYVRAICPVSSQPWCFQTNAVTVRARYLPCFLTTLMLSKEAVSVCARHLPCFLTTLVLSHKCSQCTCTLFVPSWCCQINQSLYVHSICSKLSLYAHVICSALTTLVLSDKPVSLCARYLLSSHKVGAIRRSCICTARVLFFFSTG